MNRTWVVLMCGLLVGVMGCSKVPQAEIDAAKKALEDAKSAMADTYASEKYAAAQKTLDDAIAEIEKQKSALPVLRSYKGATDALVSAKKLAEESVAAVEEAKAKMASELTTQLSEAQTKLVETRDLLARAPRGKEGKAVLEAMESELNAVETVLREAQASLESGDYLGGGDKVEAAKIKMSSLSGEIEEAVAKTK